jgi:hypothetical protein
MKKPKFNPIVTRVKLNPEQAVLACSCYNVNRSNTGASSSSSSRSICVRNSCTYVCNRSANTSSAART